MGRGLAWPWPNCRNQSSQEAPETVPEVAARHHSQQKHKSGGALHPQRGCCGQTGSPLRCSQGPDDRSMATPGTYSLSTYTSLQVQCRFGPYAVRVCGWAPKRSEVCLESQLLRDGDTALTRCPSTSPLVPTHTTLAPTPRRLLCSEWPSKSGRMGHLLQEAFSDFSPPPAYVVRCPLLGRSSSSDRHLSLAHSMHFVQGHVSLWVFSPPPSPCWICPGRNVFHPWEAVSKPSGPRAKIFSLALCVLGLLLPF